MHKDNFSPIFLSLDKLQNKRFFRIYYDGDIRFASISTDMGLYTVTLVEENETFQLEFENEKFFFNNEPFHISPDYSIMNPTPIWWHSEFSWPPSIRAFQTFDCVLNISTQKPRGSLRFQKTWTDAFVNDPPNLQEKECACGYNCPCFKLSTYYLKNEYGVVKYRLTGIYDDLFQISDNEYDMKKFKKLSSGFFKKLLKAYYIDQACIWQKVLSLESRSKKVTLSSLWLRCCIEFINSQIYDCLMFIEYHEQKCTKHKKLEKEKVLKLRSGKIV